MKVLIIEQEKTIRQSLLHFIERLNGFEIFTAHSWKESLSLFGPVTFDIVICGDRLPDADGLEILKELMKQNPKLISILMTVHGDELLKQEAMRTGIRGYLEKPFNLKQLEEAMGISDFGMRIAELNDERR
jgi:DNA-binding NtrC family response regulator